MVITLDRYLVSWYGVEINIIASSKYELQQRYIEMNALLNLANEAATMPLGAGSLDATPTLGAWEWHEKDISFSMESKQSPKLVMSTQDTVDSSQQISSKGGERWCIDPGTMVENLLYELIYIASWNTMANRYSLCLMTLEMLLLKLTVFLVDIYWELFVVNITWNIHGNHMFVSCIPFLNDQVNKNSVYFTKIQYEGILF